eukprot:CAMPEP_0171208908 /NCGR_PEP_ID=MMETSP0790-20130122/28327_1 /TAXON_ID=2925 /ORGANISM="Alexandrium catenella, Strain OF101" /LENGTH=100 /DNA_ID=CAMNT_0011674511 /DNA_START=312 /DNA_END=614 /DNA_ORIENTATION=+
MTLMVWTLSLSFSSKLPETTYGYAVCRGGCLYVPRHRSREFCGTGWCIVVLPLLSLTALTGLTGLTGLASAISVCAWGSRLRGACAPGGHAKGRIGLGAL